MRVDSIEGVVASGMHEVSFEKARLNGSGDLRIYPAMHKCYVIL